MEQRPEQPTNPGMIYEPGDLGVADVLQGVGKNVKDAGKVATVAGGVTLMGVVTARADAANAANNLSRILNGDHSSLVHVGEYKSPKDQEQTGEQLLHLDAIETADLNPGGIPLFTRNETQGALDTDPVYSQVRDSITSALSATADYINTSSDARLKTITNVTTVIPGKRIESSTGQQLTVTPTPPEQGKRGPVLVTAVGLGFLVNPDGQVFFYENTQMLSAAGLTIPPENGYVFLNLDSSLTFADYQTGTVYAEGKPIPNGIEWTGATVMTNPENLAVGTFAKIETEGRHGIAANFGEGKTMSIVTDFDEVSFPTMDVNQFMDDMVKLGFAPKFTGPSEIRILSFTPGEKPPSQIVVTNMLPNGEVEMSYTVGYMEGNKFIYTILVNPKMFSYWKQYAQERAVQKNKPVEFFTDLYIKGHLRFAILGELFANTSALQHMRRDSSVDNEVYNRIGGDITSITIDYTPEGTSSVAYSPDRVLTISKSGNVRTQRAVSRNWQRAPKKLRL